MNRFNNCRAVFLSLFCFLGAARLSLAQPLDADSGHVLVKIRTAAIFDGATKIAEAKFGERLHYSQRNNDWFLVDLRRNGTELQGWISSNDVEVVSAPRPAMITGWGQVVDPLGDCRVVEESGTLSITVPGTNHDLFHGMDAPRVLQKVNGDFSAQVRVRKFDVPEKNSGSNPASPTSYVSGGLLVWQSDQAYVRFQRAANGDSGFVGTFVNLIAGGKHIATGRTVLPDSDHWLRVERRDGKLSFAHSTDGQTWTLVQPKGDALPLHGKVQVGVFAINATNREVQLEFTEYDLTGIAPPADMPEAGKEPGSELPPARPPQPGSASSSPMR